MDKDAVIKTLSTLGIEPRVVPNSNEGWITTSCPFSSVTHKKGEDSNPSFAVRFGEGVSGYNCFSCGEHGSLSRLPLRLIELNLLGANPFGKDWFSSDVRELSLDTEKLVLESNTHLEDISPYLNFLDSALDVPIAREYLLYRGLTIQGIKDLDVKYNPYSFCVVFPIKNKKGVTTAFIQRVIDFEHPLYNEEVIKFLQNPYNAFGYSTLEQMKELKKRKILNSNGFKKNENLLGQEQLGYGDTIILTEGLIGYATLYCKKIQYGLDFIPLAVMGSSLAQGQVDILKESMPHKVIILFDDDKAGKEGSKKAFKLLKPIDTKVIDWYTLESKDVDLLTCDELKKILNPIIGIA